MERFNQLVQFYVPDAAKTLLDLGAQARGQSLSEFARRACVAEAIEALSKSHLGRPLNEVKREQQTD
jgi:hypothetical protein